MRSWIISGVALLLGLVAGSIGPKADLRAVKEELEKTKKLVGEQNRNANNLSGLTRIIGIKPAQARKAEDGGTSIGKDADDGGVRQAGFRGDNAATNAGTRKTGEGQDGADAADTGEKDDSEEQNAAENKTMKERLDDAVELWKTRSDIARATTINNIGLTAEETMKFDVLVEAMNVRVGYSLQKMADTIKTNDNAGAEVFIRTGNELTGAIVQGYSDMDRSLPQGWRERAGSEFNMTDFIDPNVAKPLLDVEDKLEKERIRNESADGGSQSKRPPPLRSFHRR